MTDYLARLNPEQRAAVETLDGPLLVLAGAGTGKTRVLTTRFAHILLTRRAFPNQVLAVTFTNKAAREMRERVAAILGQPAEGLWLGTFHALCARMLRRHAPLVGLTSSFNILDADDQIRLLKQIMEANRVDPKRWVPQALMAIIQRWKDRGITPAGMTAAEDSDFADNRATLLYAAYQDRLKALNCADFGDLLLHMTDILRAHPDVLAQYHRSFRYILVDEYQDTNVVQYLWLRLLAQQSKNICCVGDDDQSIYSWRGAEVENILKFEKDFPGAHVVRLEQNYRSTAPILAAASGLIAHNEGRLGKTLRPGGNDPSGDKIAIVALHDSTEEARMVGERMETLRRDGHPLAEMAVLVRTGAQTRAVEERLIAIGLPYRVVGGLRFYERAEIRDAIAYARLINQPADDLALERIINVPKRGIGSTTLRDMHARARERSLSLHDAAASLLEDNSLRGQKAQSLRDLLQGFLRWRAMLASEGHIATIATMLDESGYTAMWQADKSPEAPGRLENLKELVRALADFENLAGFLEHVSLVMENVENKESDQVQLMTLHAAKGLEFDTVFLPGWEEGLFPSQRSMDSNGNKGLEEERRLAYVGLHPRPPPRRRQPRRQPPALRQLAKQHPQPLHRRNPRGTHRTQRQRRPPTRPPARPAPLPQRQPLRQLCFRRRRLQPVPPRRPQPRPPPPHRSLGTARTPRPRRRHPRRRPRLPPEIRLRHRPRRRRRPPRHRLRQSRRQTRPRSLRRTPMKVAYPAGPSTLRHATELETLSLTLPESAVPAYESALETVCGTVGFFLDDATNLWTLEAVRDRNAGDAELTAALAIASLLTGLNPTITRQKTPAEGWLARSYQGFPEQQVGHRFLIRGTHLAGPNPSGRKLLVLDAGIAFGSGEHGSTQGCLRALEALAKKSRPRRILDLGTGTGILAMAAAKLTNRPVTGTDIEPWSVRTARENAARNHLRPRTRFLLANGWRFPTLRGPHDLVFANILARPLCAMARDLARNLAPGGHAILAGLLDSQRRQVLAAHRRQRLTLERALHEGQWTTLILKKRKQSRLF